MTIGIVGAGQLGRMMALAGYPLGFDFLFLDKDAGTPGGQVAPLLAGALDDRGLLGQLAQRCEVVTFDWENIPVASLENLPGSARISPPLRALAAAQDRLTEKRSFELLGIPTTRYAAVDSRDTLALAVQMPAEGPAACALSATCNLSRMLETWFLTVFRLTNNCRAISLLLLPCATRERTSSSRSVSSGKAR